jgi:hypothetical protein
MKWRRYAGLRARIARYAQEESRLRAEYQSVMQIRHDCGNPLREAEALLAVADERRRRIEECEREIWRIW